MSVLGFVDEGLADLENAGLRRTLRTIDTPIGAVVRVDGREIVLCCSNDYLGLANHPALVSACATAAKEWGAGSGASRLVSGSLGIHEQLERRLAQLKNSEDAVLFPTGYMANIGVITALVGKEDAIVSDQLNHASIVDGARLSGAKVFVYTHLDLTEMEKALIQSRGHRRRLVVTDSVFSMDGDLASLPQIAALASKHDAMFVIDDAHGTGVLGSRGQGATEHWAVDSEVHAVVGTLSKALGGLGGFVAASEAVCDWLRNRARSFIYTTAPPPGVCGTALAALELLLTEPERISTLGARCHQFAEGLRELGLDADPTTPIFPIVIGGAQATMRVSDKLLEEGYLAVGIRPPTVPNGTARLRVTLSAAHSQEQVAGLLESLGTILPPITPLAR
jgi:8-amino-7-oxononanoate synthase